MKSKFLLAALVTIASATRLFAQQHTVDCWLENDSPYRSQTNFKGVEPSKSDLQSYMQTLAQKYTVPVEVIAAICFQESQAKQYDANDNAVGFLIHNLDECRYAFHNGVINSGNQSPPPGLGLMQLTSITATDPSIANHDPVKDITDWRYNLEAGVQVLAQKYQIVADNSPTCVANILNQADSRKILENWFYAIQFYNGAPTASHYRDSVYDYIKNPAARIQGLFVSTTITRPEAEIPGFDLATTNYFAVDKNGTWTDQNCATHAHGSASVHISTSFAMPYPNQFANISTRGYIGTNDGVLIGGFIVTGVQSKEVMLRGIGPSTGIVGALADPVLELHNAAGPLAANDNWGDASNAQDIAGSTIAPKNAKESAILMTLAPGNYTAILHGANNATGIGLVELYDLNTHATAQLANISTRGLVQTGDNVLIGGLIVVGQTSQKLIVRALGPSLPVTGPLMDPTLELHNAHGDILATNDNWKDTQEAAIQATTVPPTDDRESAIVTTLTPGNYTAIVRGAGDLTGVASVEAYVLD